CFHCHGPDEKERKADLRLDTREGALAAITPGQPESSLLFERIAHPDIDERMPPAKSNLQLSPEEIDLLKRWIKDGAEYDRHWAFKLPKKKAVPDFAEGWGRNPIDAFIGHRLAEEGLEPSPEADRRTLLRRVTLDLTGLPPTPEEIHAFLKDESPDAYEKAVDRLLSSVHYGERMTLVWLDAARYADTGGYQGDTPRTMWPWRDWVIRAYNRNLPFDRFTVEQLAGDMLPEPTMEQRLATGFNRNHRINNEGGVLADEFLVEYVADRVETTGAVWLGLTIGCARCHSHKYDPIEQTEYFQLFAYFNGVPEKGKAGGNAAPTMVVSRDAGDTVLKKLEGDLAKLETELDEAGRKLGESQRQWEASLTREVQWTGTRQLADTANKEIGFSTDLRQLTAIRLRPGADRISTVSGTLIPPDAHQIRGRYVRVQLPGKKRYLSLAEVEVFDRTHNVARGGKATQSTTGFSGAAQLAIDGKTSSSYSSKTITHTLEETEPWWEVDLG
ncbi:MAG: DUF1549 domain-containing protein, partial [Verrucomicrobiota bacterium]